MLLGIVLALLAATLGAVASVDHRRKQHRINAASVTYWFCVHQQRMCGHETPGEIERSWTARERRYKAGAAVLLLSAPVGLFLVGSGRRRASRAAAYARRNVSTASTRR